MVDGVEGFVVQNRESAGGESADEEGTEEAGRMSDGDSIYFRPVIFFEAGALESLVDNGHDCFEVRTGGDFGNDATVGFKNVDLGNDDV